MRSACGSLEARLPAGSSTVVAVVALETYFLPQNFLTKINVAMMAMRMGNSDDFCALVADFAAVAVDAASAQAMDASWETVRADASFFTGSGAVSQLTRTKHTKTATMAAYLALLLFLESPIIIDMNMLVLMEGSAVELTTTSCVLSVVVDSSKRQQIFVPSWPKTRSKRDHLG